MSTLSGYLTDTVNPFISIANGLIDAANALGGDYSTLDPVTVNIPSIPDIPTNDIPSISPINTLVGDSFGITGITDPGTPAYTFDLGQDEMAILGSIAAIAAPVTGTESSGDIGNFLAPDSIMNLGTTFDSFMSNFLAYIPGEPLSITATLPLDWTNLVAESLNSIFTA